MESVKSLHKTHLLGTLSLRIWLGLGCGLLTLALSLIISLATSSIIQTALNAAAVPQATPIASRLQGWVLGIGITLSIVNTVLCWFFVSRLTRPVSELAQAAERIKLGQPHQSVHVSEGSTEVNSLAQSLNSLFTTLTTREKELKTLAETQERRVSERTLELVLTNDSLLNQIEENKRLQDQQEELMSNLVKLASTDHLTQTFNRRVLFQVGSEEFRYSRMHNKLLSVLMLDIDDFKQVNDTFDHAAGDEALQKVALRCRELIRDTDTIGRYGGEEFVIVLPDTDAEAARTMAECLRQGVTQVGQSMSFSDQLQVTASIGIATLTPEVADFEALVVMADHAHYIAKHSGKNQISAG